ncbi:BtrH N-terminal domain-containing protein [Chloroflexi bacterium TSY]|nr:BtrH N-terminal domain-containing protein [Chloroflexi bacterium TSY]
MPKLENYNQFDGLHWETGTVRNFYDYIGVLAPHTNKPYSEALLMGISGGAVMGYFSFAYKGYDPMARILTRNTFNPLDTLLERLGAVQERKQTSSPKKGLANLIDTLEDGCPAIVWADLFSLPYNALPYDEGMWGMLPILVYGYDETADTVWIADRARVPLTTTTEELATARARIKKDKFRILTLDLPDPDKLQAAVSAGIWDCIKLYTEKPPKGSRNNFGLAAYQWWAKLLTRPETRLSWEKEFPAGRKMVAGLTSAFSDVMTFGKEGSVDQGGAERYMYANFLDEASIVLDKSALREVAEQFRASGQAWHALAMALLPDNVEPLREIRDSMLRWQTLFINRGNAALDEIHQSAQKIEDIKVASTENFPLTSEEITDFRKNLAEQVLDVYELEEAAILQLRDVMS